MEWFSGGVLNAISQCRQEKALFVVYISDDSDASRSTSEAWNDDEVILLLKSMKSVALRVSKNSTEFNQFSQFFAVFAFPSVYCIDLSGKPLVIMNGEQTREMLKDKLNEAFLKLQGHITADPVDSDSEMKAKVSKDKQPDQSASSVSESSEDKLKRYEEKIKQRREARSEANKQREKQRELDRRSQGSDVSNFRETQAEQRNEIWLKERQKQKEEAQLARNEVRAKLEQDRREREDRNQTVAALRQRSQKSASGTSKLSLAGSNSTVTRVQLRLPMGSTKVVELSLEDTLGVLRQKVSEVLDSGSAKFSLTRLYPRQELTVDMDLQSMVELTLAPTAVVIVKIDNMRSSNTGSKDSSSIWAALISAMNYIVWIFNVIRKFVVGLFSSPAVTPAHPEGRPPLTSSAERRSQKFRQEDYQDEDSDDMGTYNGNSTQQQ